MLPAPNSEVATPASTEAQNAPDYDLNSGPAEQIWRNLRQKLSPSDVKLFFLEQCPMDVKERSNKIQDLLLQLANPGAVRALRDIDFSPTKSEESDDGCNRDDMRDGMTIDFTMDELLKLVEIAHDNDTFTTLCLLFDKEIDPRFDMVALPHLSTHFEQEIGISALITDILTFAHWRSFGIKDPTEHIERESRLLGATAILKDLRFILGLPAYEEIRYRYL